MGSWLIKRHVHNNQLREGTSSKCCRRCRTGSRGSGQSQVIRRAPPPALARLGACQASPIKPGGSKSKTHFPRARRTSLKVSMAVREQSKPFKHQATALSIEARAAYHQGAPRLIPNKLDSARARKSARPPRKQTRSAEKQTTFCPQVHQAPFRPQRK